MVGGIILSLGWWMDRCEGLICAEAHDCPNTDMWGWADAIGQPDDDPDSHRLVISRQEDVLRKIELAERSFQVTPVPVSPTRCD